MVLIEILRRFFTLELDQFSDTPKLKSWPFKYFLVAFHQGQNISCEITFLNISLILLKQSINLFWSYKFLVIIKKEILHLFLLSFYV